VNYNFVIWTSAFGAIVGESSVIANGSLGRFHDLAALICLQAALQMTLPSDVNPLRTDE
jgi:hypothetical protein